MQDATQMRLAFLETLVRQQGMMLEMLVRQRIDPRASYAASAPAQAAEIQAVGKPTERTAAEPEGKAGPAEPEGKPEEEKARTVEPEGKVEPAQKAGAETKA